MAVGTLLHVPCAAPLLHAADRVYWQLIDNIPHIAERLQPDEDDEPLHIRLTHPASGQAWEVPLVCVQKDGYQFEVRSGMGGAPVLFGWGARCCWRVAAAGHHHQALTI